MNEWWSRLVILALLAIVLGVPFLFRPADASRTAGVGRDNPNRLVIITPHNEQIRHELGRAFNERREADGKPRVTFDWRSSGGTSDLRKMIIADFTAMAMKGLEEDGIGADLFFGGGDYEHNQLARGITITRGGTESRVAIVTPIRLPDGMLKEVFPEPTIGGERLYHPDLAWAGAVLSSFGIVYNRDVLGMLGLEEPKTWSDLADGRYVGWVALADPGHSGSIAATYNTILRRMGWQDGWKTLRRIFGNARYFTSGASKVPVDVSAGEAAAGMCIDFYGRYQAGAIGGNRVGYVDPFRMTATTADPITILRGAPHADLANEFVVWILTQEGQRLWQRKIGSPGGADSFELRRQPIRKDMYVADEMEHWVDQVNLFAVAEPLPAGMPDFYRTVAPIAHAMAIDIHADLSRAWRAILANPRHPRRQEMLRHFDAMPPELTLQWPDTELAENWRKVLEDKAHPRHEEVARTLQGFVKGLLDRWKDGDQQLRDRLDWTLFFREQYRQVVKIAAQSE